MLFPRVPQGLRLFGLGGLTLGALTVGIAVASPAQAAAPSAAEALQLKPIQADVAYDEPTEAELATCTVSSEKLDEGSAWVVRGAAGQILRCFADTNGDNRVDQWRYYLSGIESYRDVDADFNGKADQYRWLGLSGTRWGLDKDEDGTIDSWKSISAEEVTHEIMAAVRDRDVARFRRILLDEADLKSLGLAGERQQRVAAAVSAAPRRFTELARSQRAITADTKWLHFGASQPGTLPSGTDGSTRDVTVYENVVAMLDKGGQPDQLSIGTLVRVGECWKAVDVPIGLLNDDEALAAASYILQPAQPVAPTTSLPPTAVDPELQKLAQEIDTIEQTLRATAPGEKKNKLYDRQAAVYEEMARRAKSRDEQETWIKQLSDSLNTAVQTDNYPDGVVKLEKLANQLAGQKDAEALEAYVMWRFLSARYALQLSDENADFTEVQKAWHKQLEDYVSKYPKAPDTQEAMLQLAMNEEFADDAKAALDWYDQITQLDDSTSAAQIARGARVRLTSVGKPIALGGKTVDNRSFSTKQLQGNLVLVHYWATWSPASLQDNKGIQELLRKFGSQGFRAVGVAVDENTTELKKYLDTARLNWPQLYEPQGLNGTLAVELGIRTVPTMLLLDERGNLVNRNIMLPELEELLDKNLRDK